MKKKKKKIKNIDYRVSNYDKYITIKKFNKLTGENFTARLRQTKLVTKVDIPDFGNKTDFDEELININITVTSNKICIG